MYIRLVQTKQKQVTSNNIVIRIYLIVTISYETHTHAHTRTKREKDRKKLFFKHGKRYSEGIGVGRE